MRNLFLLVSALSIVSAPAFAQSNTATASPEVTESKKPATKKVCKRVADVNSLVAKKVCRVVAVEANPQPANQNSAEQSPQSQGGGA